MRNKDRTIHADPTGIPGVSGAPGASEAYIVSDMHLQLIRAKIKDVKDKITDDPLIFNTRKVKIENQLSSILDDLTPGVAEQYGELIPHEKHVCKCGRCGCKNQTEEVD